MTLQKKSGQSIERAVGNWEQFSKIVLNNEILCFLKTFLKEVNVLFNWKWETYEVHP